MSHNSSTTQVLARKWRPRELSALVGQEHVVRALRHALQTQRLHHAYLFTGTRGVGKTTLARILAKALNCETGITDTPCGQCNACREIDQGRFVDLLEVDAATNTGVDEMRDLLENAAYAPTAGRYKVYVIDEVHMLSKSAFNAMLKTLEEPPPHMLFILATTDPQKIPVTVLSRCLQFNLKQMPPAHVVEHLQRVLTAEGIAFDAPALQMIGRAAQGSMRDALSLTDQAIAHGAGQLTQQSVQDMLGSVDQSHLLDILDALAAQDGAALLAVADDMANRSLPLAQALQNLAGLLYRLSVAHIVPSAVAEDDPDRDALVALCQRFSPSQLQLYYQIASHGRRELMYAPDEATGFGMCLLRMLAFLPQTGAPVGAATGPAVETAGRPAPASRAAPSTPSAGRSDAARQSVGRNPVAAEPARGVPQRPEPSDASDGDMPAHLHVDEDDMYPVAPQRPVAPAAERPASERPAAERLAPAAPRSGVSPARTALQALGQLIPSRSADTSVEPAPPQASHLSLVRSAPAEQQGAQAAVAELTAESPPRAVPTPRAQPAQVQPEPAPVLAAASTASALSVTSASSAAPAATVPAAPISAADSLFADLPPEPAPVRLTAAGWPDRDGWPDYVQTLQANGLLRQMLDRSQLEKVDSDADGDTVHLTVAVRAYLDPGHADRASQLFTTVFDRKVTVKVQLGQAEVTAQARADALARQRQATAEQSIREDSFVRSLQDSLGASVVPGSVRPL